MIELLDYLKNHCAGHKNAITGKRLATILGIEGKQPDIAIRRIVRHLRCEHNAPIGSSLKKPIGYFFIISDEDKNVSDWVRRKGLGELHTASHIKKTMENVEQLPLTFGGSMI